MKYTRTDLCPMCSTRLDLDAVNDLVVSVGTNISILYYKCQCSGCNALWKKEDVLDFWISAYKEHFNA